MTGSCGNSPVWGSRHRRRTRTSCSSTAAETRTPCGRPPGRRVLVRDVGIPGHLRVTAGTETETSAFLDAVAGYLSAR
ncbi:hypothetical protein QJS66_06435 [Kocuria rhizophila]|nr:hypothetical protein QJS66_06435 [Kocuria rhizophila]